MLHIDCVSAPPNTCMQSTQRGLLLRFAQSRRSRWAADAIR